MNVEIDVAYSSSQSSAPVGLTPGVPMPYFSRDLIKAINGWQAGSVGKAKKIAALKTALAAQPIDKYYCECNIPCFRRSVLRKLAVTNLFFKFYISEETSAWTTSRDFAVKFRNGPPARPDPGVIFKHSPSVGEVVLNLDRLYDHPEFISSVDSWQRDGLNVSGGIRKFVNTQHEVIMSVERVLHDEIFAFGSNASEDVARGEIGGLPLIGRASRDPMQVEKSFSDAGLPLHKWVFDESVRRIYMNWIHRVDQRLNARFSR